MHILSVSFTLWFCLNLFIPSEPFKLNHFLTLTAALSFIMKIEHKYNME